MPATQPSFATSFWHPTNPTSALSPLFAKLHQGTLESDEFLTLVKAKAAFELEYGRRVYNLKHDHRPNMTGFGYEGEGEEQGAGGEMGGSSSTLKNAFIGLLGQMSQEGQTHLRISEDLVSTIVKPFEMWCKGHKGRVDDSKKIVLAKVKEWERECGKVENLRVKYFGKWREFEDLKSGLTEEEINAQLNGTVQSETNADGDASESAQEHNNEQDNEEDDEVITLGPIEHSAELLKETLHRMLTEIKQATTKVTLLGTYTHTITGLQLSTWLQTNLSLPLDQCEEFGQDLLENGFIRKVNTSIIRDGLARAEFVGSRSFVCQWRPMAYSKAGMDDPFVEELQLKAAENAAAAGNGRGSRFGGKVNEYLDGFKSAYLEEKTLATLQRDIEKLDQVYLHEVLKLDSLQCSMHEVILDNLKALETYERDRIQALKRVMLDYSTIVRSSLNQLEDSTAKILTYRESVNVTADIQLLISTFGTGHFKPVVTLYDNYHKIGKPQYQLFGSDLVSREKYEGKPVPVVITTILQYLDEEVYPSLQDDKARVQIWLDSAQLRQQYELRDALQTKLRESLDHSGSESESGSGFSDSQIIKAQLKLHKPLTITSVLKLYLLSLPITVIPQSQYDLLKSLYFQHSANTQQRHLAISSILKSLPKPHYMTLKVLLRHFTRIAGIIKDADPKLYDVFIRGLALELGDVLLSRELEGSVAGEVDGFKERFVLELLTVKELIGGSGKEQQRSSAAASRSPSVKTTATTTNVEQQAGKSKSNGNQVKKNQKDTTDDDETTGKEEEDLVESYTRD